MQTDKYELDRLHNRLTVRGDLVATTALRIGAGRSNAISGSDLPVLRDALNKPFIPGASLKGSFRARVEALVRAVVPGESPDLKQLEDRTRNLRIRKSEEHWDENKFNNNVWRESTLIDQTFGSPEIAGRIFFKDALIDEQIWFGQFEVRNGVAINRDAETAESKHLYDYEVIPSGTRFDFQLTLENAQDWQLGMVLLALKPWENGDVQIGGFRSRGLGYVKLENTRHRYVTLQQHKPDIDNILQLWGVGEAAQEISNEQTKDWIDAFCDELTNRAKKGEDNA